MLEGNSFLICILRNVNFFHNILPPSLHRPCWMLKDNLYFWGLLGDLGGMTLGTGVTISFFQRSLHFPNSMEEFRISQGGNDNCVDNIFISWGGRSPGGTDFLVLIFSRRFWTSSGFNFGTLFLSNSGISMSSSLRGSYSWEWVSYCLNLLNITEAL